MDKERKTKIDPLDVAGGSGRDTPLKKRWGGDPSGRRKGFALLELMVSVFLFSILSGLAYLSLELGRRTERTGGVEIELQQNARKGMTEFLKDLRETNPFTLTLHTYTDSQNGEVHQMVAFASARGDSTTPYEGFCVDGVPSNGCFHVDSAGSPSWRALILYGPHETPDGRRELRRYVIYQQLFGSGAYFPFTFTGITSSQIQVRGANGSNFAIARGGVVDGVTTRVVMENLATEDADGDNLLDAVEDDGSANPPVDNADNFLNRGADFSLNGRILTTTFFLRKRESPFSTTNRFVVRALRGSVEMRN